MTGVEHSVTELIARFALRRNANSAEFMAGVFLVSQGAVRLKQLSRRVLRAVVRDDSPQDVSIIAIGSRLVGDCSCGARGAQVCRHQGAAAHAVWLQRGDQP